MEYKFKSVFKIELNDYIKFRRDGGSKFRTQTDTLRLFDKHIIAKEINTKILVREDIMSFLYIKEGERITNVANKATVIRGFLRYLKNIKHMDNIFNEIPPISQRNQARYISYIFSDDEISSILYHAHNYTSNTPTFYPNIRNVISCVFAMLYGTGMRSGEISNLKVQDVDLSKKLIYIRESKNYNKRIVPISDSLALECERYCLESLNHELSNVYFFDVGVSKNNGRLDTNITYYYFRQILNKSKIKHHGKGIGPRVHDLRHTFCCHSLRQLSKLDGNINSYIVYLSTYLGHKSLYETEAYIWITADLFKETLEKMELYTTFIDDIYKESQKYEESI